MRRNYWYLITTVVLIVGTFMVTIISGNTPVLGLDLQGGIEVRLQPVGPSRGTAVLDKAVDIIRNRVNGLGVAETEVKRDGNQIVVDLPGVKDRDKARRLVGKTAELRFRPVLNELAVPCAAKPVVDLVDIDQFFVDLDDEWCPDLRAGQEPPCAERRGVDHHVDQFGSDDVDDCDRARHHPDHVRAHEQLPPLTTAAEDKRDATVWLCTRDGKSRLQLAPTALTGKLVTSADARFQSGSGWEVLVNFNGEGHTKFDALAASSISKTPPQNQVAIVLDGVVQSNPQFNASSFPSGVSISGKFNQSDAEDLATVLRFGSLPVQLKELTTTSVSPTLGKDQLAAGILAGVIGLALVALYMVVFYRILGMVVVAGLVLSGMAVYTIIAYLGDSIGLTLTLAGVVGLIVSVGITVDSYIVYFERLKDEVRTGRTVRSSVDRGFTKSFRTILAADLVSLIAAAILYWRAIGSVRQFAFLLGLSTILDLLISYFYMHPMVQLLAQNRSLVSVKKVGIAAGLDTPEATV